MKGIIINQDTDGILKGEGRDGKPFSTVEDLKNFVREFEGTQITDYFINVFSTLTTYPSKVCTSKLDKFYRKEELGAPVDYSDITMVKAMRHFFEDLGVDHNHIMIETFKEIGINPWLSFRMNDFHYRELERSFCFSDFYYEHPEVQRIKFHP